MIRKILTTIFALALLNLTVGCTVRSAETTVMPDHFGPGTRDITAVVLESGETRYFNDDGGIYYPDLEAVRGIDREGAVLNIPASDILYVRVQTVNQTASAIGGVFLAILIIAGILVIGVAASSCPLVYSFDGENYVFDAEPLGGSVSKGLEKTDWSRLENLRVDDGSYKLLVRNELPETQHLDEMRLLVADHPKGTRVYPDLDGVMHAARNIRQANSVTDENGRDVSNFFAEQDFLSWQSKLPSDDSFRGKDTRNHLTFTFPRPEKSDTAYLLVNAGTATWGSNMIREMLKLRGDKLDTWYADIDARGPELLRLGLFILREELYMLKVYVREGDAWMQRSIIAGSGPYMTEDRLYALDISQVTGETLEIRLNPPIGFWAIDQVAVSYDKPAKPDIRFVAASEAIDQDGGDVAARLAASDGQYHDMPLTGQFYNMSFPAPPAIPGRDRSLFLQTSGYYKLHLPQDTPEQTELIQQLMTTPGMIAVHSLDQYLKWRKSNVAYKK